MNPTSERFMKDIQNANADIRYATWIRANDIDPEVIVPLGKLLGEKNTSPGVKRAVEEALKTIVHSVGKSPASPRRQPVVKQLITLTNEKNDWTRAIALRHLSLIGSEETVPAAAKQLRVPASMEEAVFCLERLPGQGATQALMAGLLEVPDAFKPRVLAALGHRGDELATELCAQAMGSANQEIALAGLKAMARIGKKPENQAGLPNYGTLTEPQKTEFNDAALRFADAQVKHGNLEEAFKIYRDVLGRKEEHLQCAAIIGLAKTKSPEAAVLIYPKLKSENQTVRITAAKAWAAMAKV
jgi:HEAT repeat protein